MSSKRPSLNGILNAYQNPDSDHYVKYMGQRVLSKEAEMLEGLGKNPFRLNDLKWARDTAQSSANEAYPDARVPKDVPKAAAGGWNNTDGHRDAYRHALWAALTAREMTKHLGDHGATWTENFLYRHEGRANNNRVQEAMDLYNNNVGLKIFRENPKASPEKLAELVQNAVDRGQTVVVNKSGQLEWSDRVPVYGHGSAEHPVRKRAMAEGDIQLAGLPTEAPTLARAANVLVDGNDRINRQFAQALSGTGGDRDTAAMAVHTISQARGYQETADIRVLEGKSGAIVSQGNGATEINLPLQLGRPGDFERVSAQLSQTQVAQNTNSQPTLAADPSIDQTRKSPTIGMG
jgi:hypothetical protein